MALADLDGDLLIDIVLAGLRAPVTVLWNRGGLRFERAELAETGTRAVAAVDIDGNGELDLAFTRSGAGPALWRGSGPARAFERPHPLWPPPMPIYAMAWADLDGDLDLDLAGATYNAELWQSEAAGQADSGVFVFENTGRALLPVRLTRNAHGACRAADRPERRPQARHRGGQRLRVARRGLLPHRRTAGRRASRSRAPPATP